MWNRFGPSHPSTCAQVSSQNNTEEKGRELATVKDAVKESKSGLQQGVNQSRTDHGIPTFYHIAILLKQSD